MFSLVQSFDDSVLYALVASRTEGMTTVMKTVTLLGEWYVLLPVAALIVFFLWRRELPIQAGQFAFAVVGTSIAVTLIKILIARPRPPEFLRVIAETGYSFPSAHVALAIAFWGYLAYLAAKQIRSRVGSICVVAVCALIILAIDYSRLYLGVHYFSDVAAGTLLGGLVLLISIRTEVWRSRKDGSARMSRTLDPYE